MTGMSYKVSDVQKRYLRWPFGPVSVIRIFNFNFKGRNLDLRLIRRLVRWDLRDPRCYSNAVVYDVTFLARGNLFQNVHFSLQDELKSKSFLLY